MVPFFPNLERTQPQSTQLLTLFGSCNHVELNSHGLHFPLLIFPARLLFFFFPNLQLHTYNGARTTPLFLSQTIFEQLDLPSNSTTMATPLLFSSIEITRQVFHRTSLAYAIVNLKPIVPGRTSASPSGHSIPYRGI